MKIKNKYDNNLLFSFVKWLSSTNTKQTVLPQWLCEGRRFALAAQNCAARVRHVCWLRKITVNVGLAH